MAKPLSLKTRVVREAIVANRGKKPKAIAQLINSADARKEDKIEVTSTEVSIQVQALKNMKLTKPKAVQSTEKAETTSQSSPTTQVKSAKAKAGSPAELIDRLFDMAIEVGGFDQLKRMVDRIAQVERV